MWRTGTALEASDEQERTADPCQRILPFANDAEGRFGAVPLSKILIARLDAGRDLPAIARAAAPAGVLGIDQATLYRKRKKIGLE